MSGLVSIAAGLIVNKVGREVTKKSCLHITRPNAMIIGLTLAGNALADAASRSWPGHHK